ncbi:MAG TPA: ATP phosphoribosyltransferase regulatory subunit, partial [Patescibacteria group bacterium]|nr:ATP phosphoribosyltransferase regulatory subunit [Patescibacteria group bacterium]
LISDAEILACTYFTYKNIGFPDIKVKINSRKDLRERSHVFDTYPMENLEGEISIDIWNKKVNSFFQSSDKIEKIGKERVTKELREKGFKEYEIEVMNTLLRQQSNEYMTNELREIIRFAKDLGVPEDIFIYSPLMTRGLDYYTGMIFEVSISELSSSVGGGGRFDNLIKNLGGPDTPAVGMAFGFDRTVEAADQLNLIRQKNSSSKVFVAIFEETTKKSLDTIRNLRENNIPSELSTSIQKPISDENLINIIEKKRNKEKTFKELLQAQLKLANDKQIPYVIIIGPEETAKDMVTLKDMNAKTQETLTLDEVIAKLK